MTGSGRVRVHPALYLTYPLLTLALFSEILLGDVRLIDRDLLHYFLPMGASMAEGWSSGSLLWDAGLDHGMPLLARWVSAVFYPTSLLYAWLPPDTALMVAALLHLPLAGVAAFRLALRHTASVAAAWTGGLAFAFSGYLLTMVGSGTYLYAAALLPLGLLALHRLIEVPSVSRCLQLALVLTMQVFVADPNTLYAEVVFCFPLVLVLYRPATTEGEGLARRWRAAGLTAAAGVMALGLSFCQLYPVVELAGLSERASGISFTEATRWSLHPLRLLEVITPGLFGSFSPQNTYWMPSLFNGPFSIGRPWATGLYVGLLPLCGVVLISVRQRKTALLWGAVLLLFLVLSMGSWTPLFNIAYALPGVDRFRYPEKYILFVTVGLSMLGAAGLGQLFEGQVRKRAIAVLGGLGLLLVIGRIWVGTDTDRFVSIISERAPMVDAAAAVTTTASALQRCAAVALALIVVLTLRRFMRPHVLALLLSAICAVDLLSAGLPLRLLGGADWLAERPALCAHLDPPLRGLRPVVWRSPTIPFPAQLTRGDLAGLSERLRHWEWHTLKPNIGSPDCVRHADAYGAPELAAHGEVLDALLGQPDRLMEVMGVRHLIAGTKSLPANYRLRKRLNRLGVAIYDVDGLPFAHPVPRVAAAKNRGQVLRHLSDRSFSLRKTAVFEARRPLPIYRESSDRSARLTRYKPGSIDLEVDFRAPGYLVVLESHYPGWQATIDGVDQQLYRANGAFMGLRVPAGRHRVLLTFAPRRQVAGLWVSGGCLAIALMLLITILFRRGSPSTARAL